MGTLGFLCADSKVNITNLQPPILPPFNRRGEEEHRLVTLPHHNELW